MVIDNGNLPNDFKKRNTFKTLIQELEIIINNTTEITHLYQMLNENFEEDESDQKLFQLYEETISLSVPQWQQLSDNGKVLLLRFLANVHLFTQETLKQIQYLQQAIELGVPAWETLNERGKGAVLSGLNNLGIVSPSPSQQIHYWQQTVDLGVLEWMSLSENGKEVVLGCLQNLSIVTSSPSQQILYYQQTVDLGLLEWGSLSKDRKEIVLNSLYNLGLTTSNLSKEIHYYQQAIDLGLPEWSSFSEEGKGIILICLYNLGVAIVNPSQQIHYYQQAIDLGLPEWMSLEENGKEVVLACLHNLGSTTLTLSQEIHCYQQAIDLGVQEWALLDDGGKKTVLECLYALEISNPDRSQQIKHQQQYALLASILKQTNPDAYYAHYTNRRDGIEILVYNLPNNTTPQMHYLSAISYAEYLLTELPVTKIDWLFSPNVELFSTLAEALLVHKLSLPNNIIQQLQYKTNDIEALVGNYSRYLVDNQQWHHPVVGDFGTLTLALIASHCPDRLLSLYRHHIDFKESEFFDEEQLESLKQSFYDDIDWDDIKQLLITEQHRNNPKQSIETLFAGYDHYKLTFVGDCRNHTTDNHKVFAKQQYIKKWDAGEVPALVFEVLQFIPTDNINKIIDFYKKFGVNRGDDEVILQTILSAWLLNNISKPLNENILTYIQSNLKKVYECEHLPESYDPWHTNEKVEHWSEYLFGLLPIPKNNLILLNVLRHCQQMQLPQWLKNAQQGEQFYIEKVWRALEISRFGLNLQFVLPNKTMVKILDEDKEAIKDALIFQMAEITEHFYDNPTKDDGIDFYKNPSNLVDPYLVLKNLAKAFNKSNVNLQIPSIVECQNHLEYGDFIVQIWQDNDTINQINLLIVDIHHQVITTTNHHLDSNIWQNISPETDLGTIEHINSSVITFLEELLNILKNINETVKKIYILPMDTLAILPWQYCWEKTSHKQNKKINSNNIGIEIISTICSWIKTKQINQLIKESSIFLNKQIIQEMEDDDINPDLPNLEFHSSQLLLKGKLSSINSNPLWLLQGLNKPMYHHIISHAIFDNLQPECSRFQYQKSNLFAWKISCGQMAGEVNLTACEALSIGSKSNRLMNELYFGPMGIGASIHAAGAQVVRGNIWLIEFLPSYLFNHHWYTHREKYNTHTSLILTQNTLRELTKKDIINFLISQKEEIDDQMTKMSLERTISEFEYLSKNTDDATRPFSHPFFWQGYCVLGFHEPNVTSKSSSGGIFTRFLMRIKEILLYLYRG